MASLIVAGGILAYQKIKTHHTARLTRKAASASHLADLEAQNAARIAALQTSTCFCATSDWAGGGCPVHDRGTLERGIEDTRADIELLRSGSYSHSNEEVGAAPPPYSRTDTLASSTSASASVYSQENSIIDGYRDREEERGEERELMVPDVRHVVPPKYEDVRRGKDGGPCRRTLKERVLRRRADCERGRVVR